MAGNLYFNRQAAQPSFYKEPLQYLESALQQKQQRYNSYLALSDELSNMQIDSRDADRARANTILQGFQTDIDKAVDDAGGDYSNIGAQLHSIGRGINKSLSPGNAGYEIASRKVDFDKADAQKRELVARGVIPERQYAAWKNYEDRYSGIGTKNVNTGLFNPMELSETTKAFEVSDLVDKFAKQIVPTNISSGKWKRGSDGTLWEYNKYGKQEVTPQRVREVVMEGLQSHQGWQDYSQQMNEFGDPISQSEINDAIDRAVHTFSFRNTQSDHNIKFDNRAGSQKQTIGSSGLSTYRQNYQDNKGFTNKIDADIYTKEFAGEVDTDVAAGVTIGLGPAAYRVNSVANKKRAKGFKDGFINTMLEDKDFKGDKQLIQQIMDRYAKSPSNPNGYDQFNPEDAKLMIGKYNQLVQSSTVYRPESVFMENKKLGESYEDLYLTRGGWKTADGVRGNDPSNMRTNLAEAMIADGLIPRTNNMALLNENVEKQLFMTDKEGNIIRGKFRAGVGITSLEPSTNGRIASGFQVDYNGGSFLMESNDDNAQEQFRGGYTLGQINHNPNSRVSPVFADPLLGKVRSRKNYDTPLPSKKDGTPLSREELNAIQIDGGIFVERIDAKGNSLGFTPSFYEDANGRGQFDSTKPMTLQNYGEYERFQNKLEKVQPNQDNIIN